MTGVSGAAMAVESKTDSAEFLDVIRSRRLGYLASVAATVGSRFFSRLISLVLVVVAARFISVEAFGAYSYLVSLALTFSVLANIGVAPVVARRVAAGMCSAREGLTAGMPIAVITFGGLAIVVSSVAWLTAPSGGSVAAVCAVGAYVVVTGPLDLNCGVLRAVGRINWEAAVHVVSAAVFALLALPIMLFAPSVVGLLLAFAVKEMAGLGASMVLVRRAVPKASVARNTSALPRREIFASGIVVSLSAVGAAILLRAPLQILGNIATSRDVAFFSVAARVADVWVLLGATVGLALFPFVARRQRQSRGRSSTRRREVVYGALAAVLLGAIAGIALPRLIPIAFGAEYARASTIAAVVALAAPLFVVPSILRQFLIAAGHERPVLGAHIIGLGALAGLAPVTIPRWGVDGAVAALCGSFAVLTACLIVVGARTERWR